MSELENFHQPEIPLDKTREIDNDAINIKESQNEKKIQQKSKAHNSVRHSPKLSNILDQLQQKPVGMLILKIFSFQNS